MPNLTVALLVLALIFGCQRWGVLEESYSSRDEVVRRGAIERGWIPNWIPYSARDIREVHDLDTNVSQLAFAYREFDIAQLSPGCVPAPLGQIVLPRYPMASWWPAELRAGSSNVDRYSFFACPQEGARQAYLALEPRNSKAYFWREMAS